MTEVGEGARRLVTAAGEFEVMVSVTVRVKSSLSAKYVASQGGIEGANDAVRDTMMDLESVRALLDYNEGEVTAVAVTIEDKRAEGSSRDAA